MSLSHVEAPRTPGLPQQKWTGRPERHIGRIVQWVRRSTAYMQEPPADLPRALRLEWQFVTARWLGIIFVAPALWAWHLPLERLIAAYALLLIAGIYNFFIQRLMRRYPALFSTGYITMLGDGLLVMAMLSLGGGFSSPFHYILFTAAVSGAMRYGRGPAFAMALTFGVFDAVESLRRSNTLDVTFAFRTGFLCLTAIYAGYLRGLAQQAERALQQRLQQANRLNEATAKLGASLEFEPALRTVVDATSHLFSSEYVVLRTSTEVDNRDSISAESGQPVVSFGGAAIAVEDTEGSTHDPRLSALLALCERYADVESWAGEGPGVVHHASLPSGETAIVIGLASPSRQISVATLAVVVKQWPLSPLLDHDTLDSFTERITLAIENASLYRTLASRTSDLQRAYGDLAIAHQDLLSVDEMKTNFIANVSHELRTPLSSIRAFSELLLSYEDDPAVQKEFVGIVNTESERLTRLVNDVLDISKIEAGRMDWHMADIDVTRVIDDSARTFAPLIEMHNLIFVKAVEPDLPTIHGDRDRIQQVLANLLNNAVKFTPAGTITLRAVHVGDEVHISVSDEGVGIAFEDQERIFEKFQQVGEMLTDKPHGTGLGLAICREIVAHHQGRLWVDSQPGGGSTFSVALKALPTGSTSEMPEPPASVTAPAEPPALLQTV